MINTAIFGMGCFWGPDDYFSKLEGVKNTRVGYSGGQKKNPNYQDLEGHTEVIEITFDSQKISYEDLLQHFWAQHNSTYPTKTQYKSVIFYQEDEQRKLAEKTKEDEQKNHTMPITTEILPVQELHPAEDYHQKYLQKNRGAVC